MDIKGHIVESLLIEEASTIQEEYYISFTLDRSAKKYLMMLSSKGGMDIEEVAQNNPDDLIKLYFRNHIIIKLVISTTTFCHAYQILTCHLFY